MTLPANTIAKFLGIESSDTKPISILLTDSRDLSFPDKTIFFALTTSGNDGSRYIPSLIQKGVRYFVVSRTCNFEPISGVSFWEVDDVLEALQTIAENVRKMFSDIPVVAITGSRGKTIVKELLWRLLSDNLEVISSPRSYNSQIGVPLSIWELSQSSQVDVFEAGISKQGEMSRLEKIISPNIGIFTSLNDEHQEGFESLTQKAAEKAKLFSNCADIFYPQGEIFIENALFGSKAKLHPIKGGNEELAIAVANFITEREIDASKIEGTSNKISPRIDVCETLKNCLIVYDGFSSDKSSIIAAINFARRHLSPEKKFSMILGNARKADTEEIKAFFEAAGGSGKFITVNSAEEFIERYSISDFNNEVILISGPASDGYEDIKVHLEAPRHETVMEVDLGAIAHNFNYYRSLLPKTTGLIAMVKADGYGVGAMEISKTLQNQGASYLAVAVINEGAELRRGGITMPIIVMNPISTNFKALFENHLEPSVFSIRELNLLIDSARKIGVKEYPIHVKLDTGMHRVGFLDDEIDELLNILKGQNYVKPYTIFSHLATADCLAQNEYTEMQLKNFEKTSRGIIDGLGYPIKRHILNTAGIMRYPHYHYDFARLGIGLYGISPLDSSNTNLETVAQLFSTIISIKEWKSGDTIGYGRRGRILKPSKIATIPIGYADGLNRHLSNGAATFIVNEKECPVVGNICMDQCMIDVTDSNASIGDKVEIFGKNSKAERLAETLGTIPYEILTSVSPRVKRIYFRE